MGKHLTLEDMSKLSNLYCRSGEDFDQGKFITFDELTDEEKKKELEEHNLYIDLDNLAADLAEEEIVSWWADLMELGGVEGAKRVRERSERNENIGPNDHQVYNYRNIHHSIYGALCSLMFHSDRYKEFKLIKKEDKI